MKEDLQFVFFYKKVPSSLFHHISFLPFWTHFGIGIHLSKNYKKCDKDPLWSQKKIIFFYVVKSRYKRVSNVKNRNQLIRKSIWWWKIHLRFLANANYLIKHLGEEGEPNHPPPPFLIPRMMKVLIGLKPLSQKVFFKDLAKLKEVRKQFSK